MVAGETQSRSAACESLSNGSVAACKSIIKFVLLGNEKGHPVKDAPWLLITASD
jgi:hypothetical protein